MKPSQIEIKKGALVPQLKKSIGSLAKLLGKMGIANISGAVEVTQTPDGLDIFVKGGGPSRGPGRCYVLTASSPTTVSGGGSVSFDAIEYDIPVTKANFVMGVLESGAFTFQTTGVFEIHYHAVVSVDIGGATSTTTVVNTVKTFLGIGDTDATRTEARFSARQKENFKDFLKIPEGETLTLTTDLAALTMVSAVAETATVLDGEAQPTLTLITESDALSGATLAYGGTMVIDLYDGSGDYYAETFVDPDIPPYIASTTTASNALSEVTVDTIATATVVTSAAILDGEGRIAVSQAEGTDPFPVDSDAVGYPEQLPDQLPTGTMFGTVSGSAMVKVTRDELGDYYLEYNGTPDLPPTVALKGGRHGGGSRPLVVESATMTITRVA
jgi:hypothetical protein